MLATFEAERTHLCQLCSSHSRLVSAVKHPQLLQSCLMQPRPQAVS